MKLMDSKSQFFNKKSGMAIPTCDVMIRLLKQNGKEVKYIQCDNVRENYSLEKICKTKHKLFYLSKFSIS